MMSLLYEFISILIFLAYLPVGLYQMVRTGKHRSSFFNRLGCHVPTIKKKGPLFWFHAVSVGETHAISSLATKIHMECPTAHIVISSISETGHATAKRVVPFADAHIYLPFDFYFLMHRLVRKIEPDVVILSEGDFWYRFMKEAKKRGAVIAVVNGKLSERSLKRYALASYFSKRLFSLVDLFLMQSELYKMRLLQLGIPGSKVKAIGNMKIDAPTSFMSDEEKRAFSQLLGVDRHGFTVVVGSSHEKEEEMIFESLLPLIQKHHEITIIVVPRHPERFSHVATVLEKYTLSFHKLSSGSSTTRARIILVDAMGYLAKCYQIADLAICCGSFVSHVGGHNILEPACYGVPVICGPHMHAQPDLIARANEAKCCRQVDISALLDLVTHLMNHPKERKEMGEQGKQLAESLRGVTERAFLSIQSLVPQFFKRISCEKRQSSVES